MGYNPNADALLTPKEREEKRKRKIANSDSYDEIKKLMTTKEFSDFKKHFTREAFEGMQALILFKRRPSKDGFSKTVTFTQIMQTIEKDSKWIAKKNRPHFTRSRRQKAA